MSKDVDEDTVREVQDLMGEKYPNLVDTYLESGRKHIEKLRESYGANDVLAIARAAHPMKSSSGNMGLVALAGYAHSLEHKAREMVDGDVTNIGVLEPFITNVEVGFQKGEAFLKSLVV